MPDSFELEPIFSSKKTIICIFTQPKVKLNLFYILFTELVRSHQERMALTIINGLRAICYK